MSLVIQIPVSILQIYLPIDLLIVMSRSDGDEDLIRSDPTTSDVIVVQKMCIVFENKLFVTELLYTLRKKFQYFFTCSQKINCGNNSTSKLSSRAI
jgi:hypothetical protein